MVAIGFFQWREYRDYHHAQHYSGQKAKDVSPPESADDRIANYTLALAILTGCLVTVSAIQIRYLIRADETTRTAADAAKAAAEAADKQAAALQRLHVATEAQEGHLRAQINVLSSTASAAHKSADIAEKSLTALNRPLVLAFRWDTLPIVSSEQLPDGSQRTMSVQWDLQYRIMNYGKSLAVIHDIDFWTRMFDELPLLPPQFYTDRLSEVCHSIRVPKSILSPTWEARYRSMVEIVEQPLADDVESGIQKYFFFGFVRYTDLFVGKTYITGQAFRFDYASKNWITVENVSYNYDAAQDELETRLKI